MKKSLFEDDVGLVEEHRKSTHDLLLHSAPQRSRVTVLDSAIL